MLPSYGPTSRALDQGPSWVIPCLFLEPCAALLIRACRGAQPWHLPSCTDAPCTDAGRVNVQGRPQSIEERITENISSERDFRLKDFRLKAEARIWPGTVLYLPDSVDNGWVRGPCSSSQPRMHNNPALNRRSQSMPDSGLGLSHFSGESL